MKESDITRIKAFILQSTGGFLTENLKIIYNIISLPVIFDDYNIHFIEDKVFTIEVNVNDELIKFELTNKYFSLQINSIEQYFFEDTNCSISLLISDFLRGKYVVKSYFSNSEKIKYVKVKWNKSELRQCNIKYKFGWWKTKIAKIETKPGIDLLSQ